MVLNIYPPEKTGAFIRQMDNLGTTALKPLVYIVDSDTDVCNALSSLLANLSVETICFSSAEAFFEKADIEQANCLLVEANLPGTSGIELLERLHKQGNKTPAIMLATYSDVPTAVRAMQANAIDFIEKPFIEGILLQRVEQALKKNDG